MKKKYFIFNLTEISILSLIFIFVFNYSIFAQSPSVEWYNFSWLDKEYVGGAYVDQRHSDYDWWYDHCTAYSNPATKTGHLGYIAVGVSKYRCAERTNPSAPALVYDETSLNGCITASAPLITGSGGSYDYANWEDPLSGTLGLGFNNYGKINPDGTTAFVMTTNYDGEYFKVKQTADANFVTVGKSMATRKRIEAPQNGSPLVYNPTTTFPNDYFSATIFNTTNFTKQNCSHCDIMKFDANGNVIFNNIYGFYDFNGPNVTFNTPNPANTTQQISITLTSQQLAYKFGGEGLNFAVDNQNNIVVVGDNVDCKDMWINPFSMNLVHTGKPILLKLDPNGNVIGKKSFGASNFGTQTGIGGSARAVGFANILGVDCYVVGYSQVNYNSAFPWSVDFIIEAFPANLSGGSIWSKTFQSARATRLATAVWAMEISNNKIYFPLITNANNGQYAGNNIGDLYSVVLDLNTGNTISNTFLTGVHAFDLKARITPLSAGGFAIVSTRKTVDWLGNVCSGGSIPAHKVPPGCTNLVDCTDWWNSDTYVAKIDTNGLKVWDKSFDSNSPFTCTDYPNSPTSGGGDPKRQECMYGVSEAPDGGIVLSGNASPNVDDNYMAKLYPDCNSQQPYDITGILNINSTITWNSSHKVNGVIRVFSGGVLNITGSATLIEFADSKQTGTPCRIEVYGTGRVNINGATLTAINCPNSMWEGIQIYGNGNGNPQTIAFQPSITLANATLKNARLAIANGIDIAPAGPAPYSSGGWITATNSTFLNNYMDIDILPYAAPLVAGNEPNNKSTFSNCTFKADNYLNDPSYYQQIPGTPIKERLVSTIHVRMNGVKGVRFVGNTFKTDLTASIGGLNYVTNFRGVGIQSTNSIFNVYSTCLLQDINGNCTGYGPANTFENLAYGVLAGATSPLKKFSVTTASFKNCNSSIYQSGINYSTVNKNKFIVDANIPQVFGNFNCSLQPEACMTHFYYTNNSSNLSHQENTYLVSPTCTQKVMGTIFNGSGIASFESYNNKYTNLYIGHQTQLTNGTTSIGMNGLQIKCNQNITTRLHDVRQTSGVIGEQGICLTGNVTTPANNIFSHYSALPPSDINGYTSGGFVYNYPLNIVGGLQDPIYKTANILKNGCSGPNFVYNSQTCPSKLTNTSQLPNGAIAKLQADALANKQITAQLNQALIDGASKNLLNAIASGMSDGNLKNLLSQYSPYLSDAVLIAYLTKAQRTPAGHITQIVTDNSPVTEKVMTVINNISLPNGIRNQINSVQVGISGRAQREKEIAYYNFQKDLNVNDIVRYYLDDTTTANTYSQITKWLEWNNSLPGKLDLIFAKTEIADFTRAQNLIDSLSADTANLKYISFLQTNKDMAVNGKTWASLQTDAATTSIIEIMANDSLHPHMGNARAALAHAFKNKKHYEFIEGAPNNNSSSRLVNNATNNSTAFDVEEGINLTAYPNPFKDELNINYSILDFDGAAKLQLIELASGRIIDSIELTQSFGTKQFNTQNLANGLYVLSLKQNNKPSVNFKVINIR